MLPADLRVLSHKVVTPVKLLIESEGPTDSRRLLSKLVFLSPEPGETLCNRMVHFNILFLQS